MKFTHISTFCILLTSLFLSGCLSFSTQVTGGAYSIEKVTVTDVWNDDFTPGEPRNEFAGNETIIAIVETSGSDGVVTMRWFHEDDLIYEQSLKTQNNYISTHIGPQNDFYWLFPGEYRVEVGLLDTPKFTEKFVVREDSFERFEMEELIPTPDNHVKQEGSDLWEIPFAFDETWSIDGEEWMLNEAKIVFLRTANTPVLSFVFVEPNLANEFSSQEDGQKRTLKVAKYAKANGYIATAEEIAIGGVTYTYQYLFITFVDKDKDLPEELTQGYRVQFAITELD